MPAAGGPRLLGLTRQNERAALWRAVVVGIVGSWCGPNRHAPPEDRVGAVTGTEQHDERRLGPVSPQTHVVNRSAFECAESPGRGSVLGYNSPLTHHQGARFGQEATLVGPFAMPVNRS